MKVKFVAKGNKPGYMTPGSSGMDLCANLESSLILAVGKRLIIPTGLFLEIPSGFEAQVRSRSGLAAKNGVVVLNSPGTIDSDYRGEVKVILINFGADDFVIEPGMRIAQLVFSAFVKVELVEYDSLEETCRGYGGFGSTGFN